ncbi:hypothetical protein [Desulforamulus aeronauticus]|uniref:Uncharacterized protein n=1 Tax=Desulforamulus aeronauticus DSM 10349 TaxID=1121421 RepID=A0A1M6SD18_9FIRM|nr:hypothetical protein [Desulforamulus aeronauticus]SHK42549.1 hypothetical protein SAMN02745123_01812 [Desulforamulus aeronauticus DSM 10349]
MKKLYRKRFYPGNFNWKNFYVKVFIPFLALSLLSGCTINGTGSTKTEQSTKEKYIVTENTHILKSVEKNILGDEAKEKVVLYAEQDKNGMPIAWSVVVDDVEKIKLPVKEEGLYSFADLKFEDVDGDHKNEVLVYRQSSGSAGAMGLAIYKPQEGAGAWQLLFAIEDPFDYASGSETGQENNARFEVKYAGDYYVVFKDHQTGLKSTIPLAKEEYKGSESLLQTISTWIDPIIDYSLVDHDGNGVKEIITLQRVIGISHVDTLALLKTTYQLKGGYYQAVSLTLYDNKDKPLAEVKL